MIIQLHPEIAPINRTRIRETVTQFGYDAKEVITQHGIYWVCVGTSGFDIRRIGALEGVKDVHRVDAANKLVSRLWKVEDTVIDLGDSVRIGDGSCVCMAGPCSIESEAQVEKTVAFLVKQNVKIMRGGVFKPRSSPYAFRGLGMDGLRLFAKACRAAGIRIITEVMEQEQIDAMYDYVDVFQVGARNAQNFNLLDALGKTDKPVLLKRGLSGTIDELLAAAEYVFSNGNERIILCERGIRTYEKAYRNTLDLNAVPVLKEKSHLPVVVDPSHGIGLRAHVPQLALAAVMAGADGLLLEIHEQPEKALSDGQQTLSFAEAATLFSKINDLVRVREKWMTHGSSSN
jgi:3-deoxy-7-phosphoheptulonate synthase